MLDLGRLSRHAGPMLRAMRVEYPGAIYHVMNRGDRREDIFTNEVDRQDLLKTLAEACLKTAHPRSAQYERGAEDDFLSVTPEPSVQLEAMPRDPCRPLERGHSML